jgi:hypothetical protein
MRSSLGRACKWNVLGLVIQVELEQPQTLHCQLGRLSTARREGVQGGSPVCDRLLALMSPIVDW